MLARHSRNLGEVIGRAFEVFPTLCHPFTHKFTPMFTPHHRPDRQAEAPHLVHPQATTRVQIHRHRPPGRLSVRQGITPHLAEPSPATLDHWRPETVAACVVVVSGVVHGAAGAQAGGSGDDGTPPTMQAPPPGLMHENVRYEGGRSQIAPIAATSATGIAPHAQPLATARWPSAAQSARATAAVSSTPMARHAITAAGI